MTKEKTFKLVATAASGLEALVGKELRDLGIPCEVENGRAVFEGTVETLLLPIYGYGQQIGLKSSLANLTPIVLMNYLKKLKHFLGKIICL